MRKDKISFRNTVEEYDSAEKLLKKLDRIARQIAQEDMGGFLDELKGKVNKIGEVSGDEYLNICRNHWLELKKEELPAPMLTAKLLDKLYSGNLRTVLKAKTNTEAEEILKKYALLRDLIDQYCLFSRNECMLFLVMQGRDFIQRELAAWKRRDNFQGYDDLIVNLHKALKNPDQRLCRAARGADGCGEPHLLAASLAAT